MADKPEDLHHWSKEFPRAPFGGEGGEKTCKSRIVPTLTCGCARLEARYLDRQDKINGLIENRDGSNKRDLDCPGSLGLCSPGSSTLLPLKTREETHAQ